MTTSLMALFGALLLGGADVPAPLLLEDFQSFEAGSVPSKGWRTRGGEAKDQYEVVIEGENRFLRSTDKGKSIQLFKEKGWSIKTHPTLTWKWRARELPDGADERTKEKNDSAAGVYVVFPKQWFVPEIIKYVWSASAPVGTEIDRGKWYKIIVLQSGKEKLGQWVSESRNVAKDFEKLFGKKPLSPLAFGFLSDANAVHGTSSADYDDISVLPASN